MSRILKSQIPQCLTCICCVPSVSSETSSSWPFWGSSSNSNLLIILVVLAPPYLVVRLRLPSTTHTHSISIHSSAMVIHRFLSWLNDLVKGKRLGYKLEVSKWASWRCLLFVVCWIPYSLKRFLLCSVQLLAIASLTTGFHSNTTCKCFYKE